MHVSLLVIFLTYFLQSRKTPDDWKLKITRLAINKAIITNIIAIIDTLLGSRKSFRVVVSCSSFLSDVNQILVLVQQQPDSNSLSSLTESTVSACSLEEKQNLAKLKTQHLIVIESIDKEISEAENVFAGKYKFECCKFIIHIVFSFDWLNCIFL